MTCHGIINRIRKELEARAASHGVCVAAVVAANMTSPSASQPLGEPVPRRASPWCRCGRRPPLPRT